MAQHLFPEINHPKKRAFLVAYSEAGMVSRASEVAGVGRSSHYRWLGEDSAYREAFDLALQMVCDLMEDEVFRRAVVGVTEPSGWYKGEPGEINRAP